jgi:hypothetical protein
MVSLQSKLREETPKGRRLQAIMSEECEAACPGTAAFLKDMMAMMSEETTPAPEGTNSEVEMMMKLCPHAEAVVCSQTTAACLEEGQDPSADAGSMKCLCACPDLVDAEDSDKMCAKKDELVGCMTSQDSCAPLVKSMGGAKGADIECGMHAAGCTKKGEDLMKCVGTEKMTTWSGTCMTAANSGDMSAEKDECCPVMSDIESCYTAECLDLMLARQKMMADGGDSNSRKEMQNNIAIGKACGGSMPTSEADYDTKVDAATGGGSTGASTDSAPEHALPILAFVASMVACFA